SRVLSLVQKSSGCGSAFHARTEFWSGLHRRVCGEVTSIQDARQIWRQFEQDEHAGVWHWLLLTDAVVRRECDIFEKLPSNVLLRSGDALHMAYAAQNRFSEVYSGDRILPAAAPHFGLNGVNVY